jgi:hypothetical protein
MFGKGKNAFRGIAVDGDESILGTFSIIIDKDGSIDVVDDRSLETNTIHSVTGSEEYGREGQSE